MSFFAVFAFIYGVKSADRQTEQERARGGDREGEREGGGEEKRRSANANVLTTYQAKPALVGATQP